MKHSCFSYTVATRHTGTKDPVNIDQLQEHGPMATQVREKQARMVAQIESICGDLKNKIILDLGCDVKGELIEAMVDHFDPGFVYGINPALKKDKKDARTHMIKADGIDMPLDSSSVDVCVSLASFEHFHDLPSALKDVHRVLKPGGILYTAFGPIWSCCWGHHLWVRHEDEPYTYINTKLPPFAHLLSDEATVERYCMEKLGHAQVLAREISEFVFHSPDQNRLFFEEYVKIVNESPLENLFFHGLQSVPYEKDYAPKSYAALFSRLRAKYPENTGFTYNSIGMLLRKPDKDRG